MGLEHRLSRVSPGGLAALDSVLNASSIDFGRENMMLGMAPSPPAQASDTGRAGEEGSNAVDAAASASMPSQHPSQTSDTSETRSIRSMSSASRNANRLSLTLPIALPNSVSSRPTPTTSMPPTPIDTSVFNSPVDSDNIIIAIAAQERRVLELREELARAEGELKRLQRQWTITEGCKKRPPNTAAQPSRGLAPAASLRDSREENSAVKRNSELERRKAILLAQSQGTLRQHNRTVMRGSHTRTLSLLSPTRSVGESSFHEDHDNNRHKDSYMTHSPVSVGYPLNKRATWAPRPSTQQPAGVKQLASDFKQGLWTFVEDLRQATIGDEAVSGTTNRTSEMGSRLNKTGGDDQDTVRASTANRSRSSLSMECETPLDSPSETSTSDHSDRVQHRRTQSRPEPRARKHYSWTPLTFDSLNDDDWSSWNSPNTKPLRWSSSTANEDVPVIPEKTDDSDIALRRKCSSGGRESSSPSIPKKFEELPQTILNHLTPIQNKTSNFIKEWEKSLSPPSQTAT